MISTIGVAFNIAIYNKYKLHIKCRAKFGKSIAYWNKSMLYRHFYG